MKFLTSLFTLLAFSQLVISCSQNKVEQKTRVTIQLESPKIEMGMDKEIKNSGDERSSINTKGWGGTISAVSDFNCFLVMISWSAYTTSYCQDKDNNIVLNPNKVLGFFALGSSLTTDVPSGTGRTFTLLGVKSSTSCIPYLDLTETLKSGVSAPVLLGKTTVDLAGSTQSVTINGTYQSTSTVFNTCSGTLFNPIWETNSSTATNTTTTPTTPTTPTAPTTGLWDGDLWDVTLWGN